MGVSVMEEPFQKLVNQGMIQVPQQLCISYQRHQYFRFTEPERSVRSYPLFT